MALNEAGKVMGRIVKRSELFRKKMAVSFWEKYGFAPSAEEVNAFIEEVAV